jgi:hypothetical protein
MMEIITLIKVSQASHVNLGMQVEGGLFGKRTGIGRGGQGRGPGACNVHI